MTSLPADWLVRPATESARRWALSLLDDANTAVERLGDPDDREALHDFRVAVRRLRSLLKLMPEQLGAAAKKKVRARLGDLVRETNTGRDAEVALEWLSSRKSSLGVREKRGAAWFERYLEERRDEAYERARHDVQLRFADASEALEHKLRRYEAVLDNAEELEMARVLGEAIRTLAHDLESRLREVRTVNDSEIAHAARIVGKRLRYALEPVRGRVEGVDSVVEQLKSLQDLLGALNDMHVLARDGSADWGVGCASESLGRAGTAPGSTTGSGGTACAWSVGGDSAGTGTGANDGAGSTFTGGVGCATRGVPDGGSPRGSRSPRFGPATHQAAAPNASRNVAATR